MKLALMTKRLGGWRRVLVSVEIEAQFKPGLGALLGEEVIRYRFASLAIDIGFVYGFVECGSCPCRSVMYFPLAACAILSASLPLLLGKRILVNTHQFL